MYIKSLSGNLSKSIESKITAVLQKHKLVFREQVYKRDCCLISDGGGHLKFKATWVAEKIHVFLSKT